MSEDTITPALMEHKGRCACVPFLAPLVVVACVMSGFIGFFVKGILYPNEAPVIVSGHSGIPPAQSQRVVVDGREILADAGSDITIKTRKETVLPTTREVAVASGKGKGVGIATDETGVSDLSAASPQLVMGGTSIQSGTIAYRMSAMTKSSAWVCYIFGGGMMAAGVALLIYLGWAHWKTGAALIAGGAAWVAIGVVAEKYPWVFLIGIVAILAVVGFFFWEERRQKKAEQKVATALGTVTKAIEAVPPSVHGMVTAKVADIAKKEGVSATVKEVISKVKAVLPMPDPDPEKPEKTA